jgi:hypothetical protein
MYCCTILNISMAVLRCSLERLSNIGRGMQSRDQESMLCRDTLRLNRPFLWVLKPSWRSWSLGVVVAEVLMSGRALGAVVHREYGQQLTSMCGWVGGSNQHVLIVGAGPGATGAPLAVRNTCYDKP